MKKHINGKTLAKSTSYLEALEDSDAFRDRILDLKDISDVDEQ